MALKKDALVEQLWSLMVKDLIARLEHGEDVVNKEGEVVNIKCPASTLSVIAKFLKDNEMKMPLDNPDTNRLSELLAKASRATDEMDEATYQ